MRSLPENYSRIKLVKTFNEVLTAPFGPANCILYPRPLTGAFNALARTLMKQPQPHDSKNNHYRIFSRAGLESVKLQGAEAAAAALILADMKSIPRAGNKMDLRVVEQYNDSIHGFHPDWAGQDGRLLCCYNNPTTEFVRNEDAESGPHRKYYAKFRAPVYRVGVGDLFRISGFERENPPPFLHRAPAAKAGSTPRLLLVAD